MTVAINSLTVDCHDPRADIGQGDVPWVVMEDVEGNHFCVLTSLPKAGVE
jgi:hypothetical protein